MTFDGWRGWSGRGRQESRGGPGLGMKVSRQVDEKVEASAVWECVELQHRMNSKDEFRGP